MVLHTATGLSIADKARSDLEGTYELSVRSEVQFSRALVIATAPGGPGAKAALAGKARSSHATAECEVVLSREKAIEVDLRLQPPQSISGAVLGENWEPVPSTVIVRMISDSLGCVEYGAQILTTRTLEDGRFETPPLTNRSYDLLVRPAAGFAEQWKTAVPAGAHDQVIQLTKQGVATVVLEVDDSLVDIQSPIYLHARLHAPPQSPGQSNPLAAQARDLPRHSRWTDPEGWISESGVPDGGSIEYSGEIGRYRLTTHVEKRSDRRKVLKLNEGYYFFGAKAIARNGQPCLPVGTGLVHISGGEYKVTISLYPTARLRGAVSPPSSGLCVALVGHDQEMIQHGPLDSLRAIHSVESDGHFSFDAAPVGKYTLVVGTEREMREGSPRGRHPVEIVEGINPPVHVLVDQ